MNATRPNRPRVRTRRRARPDARPRRAVRLPVIGLTGAPGAGKSTAARAFVALGCVSIDVDRMGHEALDLPRVVSDVRRAFGDAALVRDGDAVAVPARVDRRSLASVAFADAARLERLEAIVHPRVLTRLRAELRAIERAAAADGAIRPRAVVIDCALLFESGLDALCDATVTVTAPRTARARRVAAARGWSSDDLRRRERAQFSETEKRSRADHRLSNATDAGGSGAPAPPDDATAHLRAAVAELLDRIAPGATPGDGTKRPKRDDGNQEKRSRR